MDRQTEDRGIAVLQQKVFPQREAVKLFQIGGDRLVFRI